MHKYLLIPGRKMSGHQYVPSPTNLFADDDDVDDQLFLRNARRAGSSSASPSADQGYNFDQYQKNFLSRNYESVEEEKYCSSSGVNVREDHLRTNFTRPDVLGPEPFDQSGGQFNNYGGQITGGYASDTYGTTSVATSPYNTSSQHYRQAPGSAVYSEVDSDVDEIIKQRQTFETRRRELEESTLLTSQRCLGVLRETEQVGIATAEELHRQRDQLDKTKKQLDEINNSLRFSQKHLNSLKSVFGGLKNYLSGRMGQDQQNGQAGVSQTNISPSPSEEVYPNPQDFRIPDNYWPDATTRRPNYSSSQEIIHTNGSTMSAGGFSQQLDQNLDDMRGNLSRLKNLALDLNQEIDSQNDLIDDISNRVEDVDVKIGKQNKDINRLLRK